MDEGITEGADKGNLDSEVNDKESVEFPENDSTEEGDRCLK